MSHVKASEIVRITCGVFGVTRDQMVNWKHGSGRPTRGWPYFARLCAVYLIWKHTKAPIRVTLEAIGVRDGSRARDWVCKVRKSLGEQAAEFIPLAELLERCEQQIDCMHQTRIDLHVLRQEFSDPPFRTGRAA